MDRLLQYQQDICQQLGVGTYVNSFAQIFRPIQTDWKQIGLYSGKIFL